jgi:hypothetical protein
MQLYMCETGNAHVLTWASGREDAKRKARVWLSGDPDKYIVTPLTDPGDRVHLAITLNV